MSTSERYNAPATEAKWRSAWDDANLYRTDNADTRPKYYVLEMFPYPSGRIHMGHVRNYTMGDVVARYRRAKGFNVLHPMGWDAFGMPAENAAMQNKVHPAEWTYANIAAMRAQLKSMGLSLDWSREFATCDVAYYHQQQRLFNAFLEAGLVTRKTARVNWDPVDMTVLANEQVIDGRGWRSGALVEQRELSQWFFKITDFAEDLLESLDGLDRWPDKVRLMQRNWIGRSEGLRLRFQFTAPSPDGETTLEVFTTRPDTIYGASFMAISPGHPLAAAIAQNSPEAAAFIAECQRMGTSAADIERAEKKGYLTGMRVAHPFDETATLPVYIANFVLMEYGTGAIFGCPAHDQRDLDFARKYELPVTPVVRPRDAGDDFTVGTEAYTGDGVIFNSEFLNGLSIPEAKAEVADRMEARELDGAPQGERKVNYRLRDWGISRQRYWGCPIPVVHCEACGIVPVPDDQLPVKLPDDVTFDVPGNPLDRHPTWSKVDCPSCGKPARRETDTMDTFVDSSWYFARFAAPDAAAPIDKAAMEHWVAGRPVYRRHRARDPAPPLLALLHARGGEGRLRRTARAVRGAVHAGHGHARDLRRRPARMAAAGNGAARDGGRGRAAEGALRRADRGGAAARRRPRHREGRDDPLAGRRARGDARGLQRRVRREQRDAAVRAAGLVLAEPSVAGAAAGKVAGRHHQGNADPGVQLRRREDVEVEEERRRPRRDHRQLRRRHRPLVHAVRHAARARHRVDRRRCRGRAPLRPARLAAVPRGEGPLRQGRAAATARRSPRRPTPRSATSAPTSRASASTVPSRGSTRGPTRCRRRSPRTRPPARSTATAIDRMIRCFAPMMPHLAEECWALIGNDGFAAAAPWPNFDPSLLVEDSVTLPVQVNGKKRGEVTVAMDAANDDIEKAALALEEVQRHLEGRTPRKVIIVPKRIVNVVA